LHIQGFKLITELVRTRSKTALLWLVGGVTFFMSSVLDNLTTTIVMVSLLQRLCPDEGRHVWYDADG
jgi:Na+/H+ antiporter NhaD/arsenite permease-like protein